MSYKFLTKGDPWLFFEEDLLTEKPVFVIVGSHTGESEEELFRLYYRARIIVYEASVQNFVALVERTCSLPLRIHNKAVIGYDGRTTFFDYGKPSAHSHIRRKGGPSKVEIVDCASVGTILRENQINCLDVMFITVWSPENILLDLLDREEVKQVCFHWYDFIVKERIEVELEKKFKIVESPKKGNYACTLLIRGEKDGSE